MAPKKGDTTEKQQISLGPSAREGEQVCDCGLYRNLRVGRCSWANSLVLQPLLIFEGLK
jgi:hypothetical protein